MDVKGKVLATDLDGTLFFPKRRVRMLSKRNKKFLRHFIDEGGQLVIVSGRNRFYANKVIKRLKRPADVAGCNGAFILHKNETIFEAPMPNQELVSVIDDIKRRFKVAGVFLMSKKYNMVIPTKEFYWFFRYTYKLYQLAQGVYREPTIRSDKILHDELAHGEVYKIMLFFGVTKRAKQRALTASRTMNEIYPNFEFAWGGELVEINKKGVNKAEGLKHYLDYLKIKHDNIMVVGDSGNDTMMFRHFKNSFCMSHAPLHVSQDASHIIDSVNEIEQYLQDRGDYYEQLIIINSNVTSL